MRTLDRFGIAALLVAAIVSLLALTGCGGGENADAAEAQAAQPPPVDPRFASAEALLDYYNGLAMREPAIDPVPLFDLLYAENDEQERLIRITRSLMPYARLEQALWDRFGEGLDPSLQQPPLAPNPEPARITSREAERATAVEVDATGDEYTIHLVRIGNRWWVSGYTLEYEPSIVEMADQLEQYEEVMNAGRSGFDLLRARVESGEFNSIEEVRRLVRPAR